MVTTDGHRLSKMEVKVAGRQASSEMLIPLKAIQELRRLCDEALSEPSKEAGKDAPRAQLQISQSGSSAFFQGGGIDLRRQACGRALSSIRAGHSTELGRRGALPRATFAEALRAVSIAASERTGGVKLALAKGTMRITSESPESGDGFDEVAIDYDGPAITIGFNAKYFLDVLSALDEEEILLSMSGELDPAVVRPVSDRQFLAVVMPMRI